VRIVEFLAAFYGLVVAYAGIYLAGQWVADRLDQRCRLRA